MKSVSAPKINTDIASTQNNAFEEQPEPIDDKQTTLEPMIDQIQEQTTSFDRSIETPIPIIPFCEEESPSTPTQNEVNKRPISDSSSIKPPDSPNNLIPFITKIKN